MNRSHVIEALRAADWSNTPIGNKALIQAAIEHLEAQPSSAFRPALVISYRPGMGEVTVYTAGGVPGYMNIGDTVYVSDRAPVEQAGGDERAGLRAAAKWHRGQRNAFEAEAEMHRQRYENTNRPDSLTAEAEHHRRLWETASAMAANHLDYAAGFEEMARAALAQHSPAPTLRAAIDTANDRFEAPVAKWGTDLAGEEERPEVVAFLMKPDTYEPYVDLTRDWSCDHWEALMIVAQHERIVGALRAANAKLEKELAMARDAAAKGDAARHAAGGMEMEIQGLREKVTELQKELRSRWTYASTQATNCAGCGEHKHTPLRVDWMGGYVCLTCISKKLEELHDDQDQHSVPEGFREKFEQCVELAFAEISYYVSPEKACNPQSRARRASALATELRAMLASSEES
ncbi:hypothetical protein [Pseudomonas aeruginosa]|uniref:hypothetical protein n=1 Tax=Pseudomonas aeruginosa TaxID=287 RepID=UPI0005BA1E54|nr:hypothetical protein [Pseudomonas aeruginosa]